MGRLIGMLLVLNVVMLAAGMGIEQMRGQPGLLVDFNADKVRLLGRVERAARTPGAPSEATPAPPAGSAAGPDAAPASGRCLAWPELDADLLAEIEKRLQAAGIADNRYDIQLRQRLPWWVYLPPFADAESARTAIEAAREKGVKDIAMVRGGAMAHAVSLGAFPSLVKARAHMRRLRTLGVAGTQVGPRVNAGDARLLLADSVPETRLAGLADGWGKRAPSACQGN